MFVKSKNGEYSKADTQLFETHINMYTYIFLGILIIIIDIASAVVKRRIINE